MRPSSLFKRGARLAAALVSGTVISCAPSPDEAQRDPVVNQLPQLVEVRLPGLEATTIPGTSSRVAVSGRGLIAFVSADQPDDEYRIQVVDTSGRSIRRLGRRGAGPGELQNPLFLAFGDDGRLIVWDISTGRVTAFDTTGAFTGIRFDEPILFPIAMLGDSLDVRDADATGPGVRRHAFHGAGARSLLTRSDERFDLAFPIRKAGGIRTRGAYAYAAAPGVVAFGEGREYRVLLYSDRGAFLGQISQTRPPRFPDEREVARESTAIATMPVGSGRRASILQNYRTRPLAHFQALRFDSHGRLWIVGARDGSGFADVYADTLLIGSLDLDCPEFTGEGWDLSGGWLVLSCRNTDPDAPSDGTIRLFKIEGE